MNKHEATELGIRLIAILNVTNLLSALPSLLSVRDVAMNLEQVGVHSPWITPLVILGLLVSVFLWFGAYRIAQWMWRDSKEINQGMSMTATQLQTILFSAIGLYLLVSVIPDALEFFVYFGQKLVTGSNFINLSDYANGIGHLIQVLISVWLLFNSAGIVASLQRGKRSSSPRKTA
jgi:hypothetical protein